MLNREVQTMGHCLSCSCFRRKAKQITLLMVGLDNAGKTSTVKCLLKESREEIAPTVGFSSLKPKLTKEEVTIYDLGGGQRIRSIWKNYFAEAYGLIFVIDAADSQRFSECKSTLHELIKNEYIMEKPVLILANKQDNKDALDEADICDVLGVETVVNESKCRTKIETCSATAFEGKRVDKAILKGYLWLIETIVADYDKLHTRVLRDTIIQKAMEDKARQEREERVRKLKEEREKEMENKNEEPDVESTPTNPFRPLSEIKKELEEQETRRKSLELEQRDLEIQPSPSPERKTSGLRSGTHLPPINGCISNKKGDGITEDQNKPRKKKRFARNNKTAPLDVPSELPTPLPPIQSRPSSQKTKAVLEPMTRPPTEVKHSWGLAEELEPVETKLEPTAR